jgi:hypothetical protein
VRRIKKQKRGGHGPTMDCRAIDDDDDDNNNNNNNNNNNSIQFIYMQNLTVQRPITKLAQARKWEE